MKFNYLIKASPFISTILIIFFLSITNQKEPTKLRILVWNTPTLSLGTYLAISTGTGFIFSYFLTTNLAKIIQANSNEQLRFKDKNIYEDNNHYTEITTDPSYGNTLIERDVKDPSPTINASFRVIRRTKNINTDFINKNTNNFQYDNSNDFEDQYDEQSERNENTTQEKSFSTDWNDETFLRW